MKNIFYKTLGLTLVFLFILSTQALAQDQKLLVAFGDSITAGALANIKGPKDKKGLVNDVKNFVIDLVESKYGKSWATGSEIESFYNRVLRNDKTNKWWRLNLSRSASRVKDIFTQVDGLPSAIRQVKPVEIVIVMLTGANDLCDMKQFSGREAQTYQDILEASLNKIKAMTKGISTKVILLGPPMISNLGASKYRNAKTALGLTCEVVRDHIARYCNRFTQWKSPTEQMQLENEIHALNSTLQSISLARKSDGVIASNALSQQTFELSDLAVDCFHPSPKGQKKIAEQVWKVYSAP